VKLLIDAINDINIEISASIEIQVSQKASDQVEGEKARSESESN
jgi:hypothetical protein